MIAAYAVAAGSRASSSSSDISKHTCASPHQHWPTRFIAAKLAGPCGDNYQGMVTNFAVLVTPIQATYNQGDAIELRVYLTSNHGGKFMFRVCPRQTNLDEACFGTNYLTR
jgi:hypothetical protein